MGCSGVLWDVSGVFRGCSGLFRAGPGVFQGCSGCSRGVPGCSGAVPGFTDTRLAKREYRKYESTFETNSSNDFKLDEKRQFL